MVQPTQFDRVSTFFTADHRACDAHWSAFEAAVEAGDTARAGQIWPTFKAAMLRHFAYEEEVLFPAFEAATGMTQGPTAVMRMEHGQMRGLMNQMQALIDAGDLEAAFDHGDTLLMLTGQHNMKEERILYPMSDQRVAWAALTPQLEALAR